MRTAKIKMCWNGFTVSVFEQTRTAEHGEKILFDSGKILLGNRVARDQNQFHRPREFMLMQPEALAQQAAGTTALHSPTDFLTGYHSKLGRDAFG